MSAGVMDHLTLAETVGASDSDSDSGLSHSGDDDDDVTDTHEGKRPATDTPPGGDTRKRAKTSGHLRPPTAEEMASLRETQNLFHSNLFQLQTTEMLTEVTAPDKHLHRLEAWLSELEAWLLALPVRKPRPLERHGWLEKSGLCLPFPADLPAESDLVAGLGPPGSVTRAGSLAAGVLPKHGTVDLLLELPASCLTPKDVINTRYLRKRALYLTYLAKQLRSGCPLVSEVHFTYHRCDQLRPSLLLTPSGPSINKYRVQILPVPPAGVFKPSRLAPQKSNVQSKWLLGKSVDLKLETPTPHYNSRVLVDVLAGQLREENLRRLEHVPTARAALRLLGVWLRQRGLDQGQGAISLDILGWFIHWLLQTRRISKLMSSYQVLRNVWVQLSKTDWSKEGLSFVENPTDDQPALHQFNQCFDVVLVDPSGFYNLTWDVTLSTYRRLRDEAGRAVLYLDSPGVDSFQALFMTPVRFVESFDHIVRLNSGTVHHPQTERSRDHPAGGLPVLLPQLLSVLNRGLSDRVLLVDMDRPLVPVWSPEVQPPDVISDVTVGLRLNPQRLTSRVDRGPDTEHAEAAAEFRQFWRGRAETRRFQDGSIQEAVVWEAETLNQHRLICRQIVLHLLQSHFQVPAEKVHYWADQPELLLSQTRLLPSFPYGTGEESELAVQRAFSRLSGVLRRLHELPLGVAAVHGISPVFRHAEPFPPLPQMYHAVAGCSHRHLSSQLLERQTAIPVPWAPVCEVVLQMEISGKWPEDTEAIRRVKAAFHIQVREELTRAGLTAAVRPDSLLVLCDGYLFSLTVAYPREPALLRLRQLTEQADWLDRRTNQLPRLTSALAGLHRQHPSYSAACRLAVRWVDAQMLSGLVPNIAVELLMAKVYLSPAPHEVPGQPAVGLLRFLRRLAGTDWRETPLIVDQLGSTTMSEESRTELLAKIAADRDRLPAWLVYDAQGVLWTSQQLPSQPVLNHLQKLAAAAADQLTSLITKPPADVHDTQQIRAIFRPPLHVFDILVHLTSSRLRTRRHQAVDPPNRTSTLDPYTQHAYEALPPPEFDPVSRLVDDLRSAYGHRALVCFDQCGGDMIGLILRPGALKVETFGAFRVEGCRPVNGPDRMALDVLGLMEYIKTVGQRLVERVEVDADRLTKLAE